MDEKWPLGAFLKNRRSQLQPESLGIVLPGGCRRVPGLRREELAMLAGVSASYYARLEQGQALNASPEVLDAIAGALRLNEAERRHLHDLARAKRRGTARAVESERVAPAMVQLLEAMSSVPAVVLGRRSDVLAWNRSGQMLYASHLDSDGAGQPGDRPNMARLVFLDRHTRELYSDWPSKARAVVATLRAALGRFPEDPELQLLIDELSAASTEFASLWADHRVKAGSAAVYEMRHPLVGTLTVTQQTLHTEGDQRLIVATTEPGSPSEATMILLVHAATTGDRRRALRDGAAPGSAGPI